MKSRFKIHILVLIGLLIILFTSCVTRERCNKLFPPQVIIHDSVSYSVKETIRDTTITIPADSAWLDAYIICDSLGNAYLQNYQSANGANISLQFQLYKNHLLIKALQDSLNKVVHIKDKETTSAKTESKTETRIEHKLLGWQIIIICTAGFILLSFLIWVIIKIYKLIKK